MPGRQAHGRPLLGGGKKSGGKSRNSKRPRTDGRSRVLDALAIAADQVPTSTKGVRTRDLDPEPARNGGQKKRPRRDEDDEQDEDDGDGRGADEDGDADPSDGPRVKRTRRSEQKIDEEDSFEGFSGSDSDGNEWHLGVNSGDEDSDIDSDEAFGESDEERFDGYAFRGSSGSKNNTRQNDESEDENGDDGQSLGSDAIDLATALDQFSEDEAAEDGQAGSGSGSGEEDEGSTEESSEEEDTDEDEDDDDDGDGAPAKVNMEDLLAGFGGNVDDSDDGDEDDGSTTQPRPKLSLNDLGLSSVTDNMMRKSMKLMRKEEKATKPGSAKKLEVPLARRQQDRLLRAAAYKEASNTLDRWKDTVRVNRQADHLVFPLAQNAHDEGLNHKDFAPLTRNNPTSTALEQTIFNIMEESGLSPSAKRNKAANAPNYGDQQQQATESKAAAMELVRQRRHERELVSREQARAKRIKKIKSKVYRRIHRKQAFRDEQDALAEADAMRGEDGEGGEGGEGGEPDSDSDREVMDRRRAEERMGTRHRQSKWAKLGKKAGRAVWDEDFRQGLAEMRERNDELMRRVEGKGRGGREGDSDGDDGDAEQDDDDDNESGGSGDEQSARRHLRKQLERAAEYSEGGITSRLAGYKFMMNAEARRKKENEDELAMIQRVLDSEDDGEEEEEGEGETAMGRRQYGGADGAAMLRQRLPNMGLDKKKKNVAENKLSGTRGVTPINKHAPTQSGLLDTTATLIDDSSLRVPDEPSSWDGHSSCMADKARESGNNLLQTSSIGMLGVATASPPPEANEQAKQRISSEGQEGQEGENNGDVYSNNNGDDDGHNDHNDDDGHNDHNDDDNGGDDDDADADDDDDDDDDEKVLEMHVPSTRRDWDMIEESFAGGDVVDDFEREKDEVERGDGDKEVDNTLPGWGSWVGEDVSERERRRHQGRFVTKVEGIKKKNRKDFKLKGVIISERRVKQHDQFLATRLPFPFETKAQYERSLRLPLGPEWMTRETFQDSTKPRVIVQGGLIAPMSRPMN